MKVGERFGKKVYIEKQNREKFRIAIIYQVASYWPTIESFYKACVDDKAVEVRIPYVPEYNSDQVDKIAQVLSGLNCLTKVKVLPYHNYAGSKYEALGMNNILPDKLPAKNTVETVQKLLKENWNVKV